MLTTPTTPAHGAPMMAAAPAASAATICAADDAHHVASVSASLEAAGVDSDAMPAHAHAASAAGASAVSEHDADDAVATARRRLDEVMAQVQELEDQGRLVEASALMVESMRLQASLAGR